ncbi:hypothetical protein B0I35DRAFT_474476 [Stachybotrys elegans]|uniref:Uncharacterized protein n=1 Tax=Stachybotrys elegans TaxID=80388 RepID=A0A8K0T3B8_9HYPO|nr:hypothetical protein B0I35DRAFT_474476 [Stachybotrys elegans]
MSSTTTTTTTHCSTYAFALQKYMLLQEQHEELCSHLDQIRPRLSSAGTVSTLTSPGSSPTRSYCMPVTPSPSRRHSRRHQPKAVARCSGWQDARGPEALDTIVDEDTVHEISAEEQRLFDVNEGIKRALTELLNSDTVRSDLKVRKWVQTRLMETEKELRSGRRRKSSTGE